MCKRRHCHRMAFFSLFTPSCCSTSFLLKQTKTEHAHSKATRMTAATPRRSARQSNQVSVVRNGSRFVSPPLQTQSIRGTARCVTRSGQNGRRVQSGDHFSRSSLSSRRERRGEPSLTGAFLSEEFCVCLC